MTNTLQAPVTENNHSQLGFLNKLIKYKHPVMIFLVNGIKLEGILAGVDDYAVFLARDGVIQLIYKHSIATISQKVNHGSFRIPDCRTF